MNGATAGARKSVVVSALGVTQALAWASTYYLTAVFAEPVSFDLHVPRNWFFGAVVGALLLSGLLGPLAGRVIDRYGGRDVLVATNLVFAAGLVLLSVRPGADRFAGPSPMIAINAIQACRSASSGWTTAETMIAGILAG